MSETLREKLLLEAVEATTADRNRDYGEPDANFNRALILIRAWRSISPSGNNASMLNYLVELILIKLARLANSPDHWDSWKDIAGYAACAAEVMRKLLSAKDNNTKSLIGTIGHPVHPNQAFSAEETDKLK